MGQAQALKELLDRVAPKPVKTIETQDSEPLPDLTPEEEHAAIQTARELKLQAQKNKAYWDRITQEPEIRTYTADQLEIILKNAKTPTGKKFTIDSDNKEIVKLICRYFSNDSEFEKTSDFTGVPYSLSKGLALIGNVGVGKTMLMGFFHHNQNQSYLMANCRKLESKWVEQMSNKEKPNTNVIDQYAQAIPTTINGNPFGHQVLGVCFDDLGTETVPSKAYGEEKIVLQEILMNRYESGLPFNYTHITSNLSAHDIGIRYGTRIKDRFREMFNLIVFSNEAKSRRA
jgi:DNA replication protein DnaC